MFKIFFNQRILLKFTLSLLMMPIFGYSGAQAAGFEGVIDYVIKSADGTQKMTYFLKDNALRMEMIASNGAKTTAIADYEKGQVITLLDQNKTYMTMDLNSEFIQKAVKDHTQGTMEKGTGSKTIAGYKCDQWIYSDEEGISEVWATKDLGQFLQPSGISWIRDLDAYKKFQSQNIFPLMIVSKDTEGQSRLTMEATKVEKKKLAASLFSPPPGYSAFAMPNFQDIMKNLPQQGR